MRRTIGLGVVAALAIVATLGLPAAASGQASEVVGAAVPPPVPDATGGPDGFGYTFIDSAEPGGPTYTWVDITGTGTAITTWTGSPDDGYAGPFAIGFSFPFYGVAQTQFYAGTNGFISFGAGSTSLSNQCPLPSATTPNDVIAMLWDDLNFNTSGAAHYQYFATCPVGTGECTVVEYSNVAHYGGAAGSAGTFEAILYPSGQILIQFQNPGTETGSGSTSGIEGPGGTYGLAYACNTAGTLAANLAIRFELSGWTFTSADTSTSGARGDVVNYLLRIANNEATARTYDISHSGNVWATGHPATVGPIASGASQDFTVTVAIPWTIGQCQSDAVTISAADQSAPGSPKTIGLTTTGPSASVLYDNGPLVTHPGGGAGGADVSALQTALGMTTYGAGNQVSAGNRVADDFTVPAGETWTLDQVSFFEYQTGSTTGTSTFTAFNYQIWNGAPNGGGAVIWGDTTTNRLASSAWSNIYRVLDTTMADTTRPIMANVCTGWAVLPTGTYWIDWQAAGSLASGPWQPAITILGQTTTGNALQYTTTAGAWAALTDVGTQGLPFRFSSCRPAADWGDAQGPSFPTTAAQDGARHLIPSPTAPNAILGALIDADDDGQPNAGATGDDGGGLADEDGVIFVSSIVPGSLAAIQVVASGSTLLQAWVDFNLDGDWDDAGEQIFTNQALSAGVNGLNFTVPVSAVIGNPVARFRVSSQPGLGYGGVASDGEVEDYLIATTPVELQSFVVE
ncbi:MAG: hypothetical protein HY825_18745 [Acidobacteria bacterium]|nr:hypothetical protein [Acidobacteriota bacterium]